MKIKTRLRFNTLFSVAIVLLIGLMLFNSSQKMNRAVRENRSVNQVVRAVFGLNILSNDYLLDQSDRAKKQWHLRYNSLSKLIGNINLKTQEDSLMIEEIEKHNGILKNIFSQLTTEHKSMDDSEEVISREEELRERLADKLITKSQAMVSDAEQLLESTSQRVISIQQDSSLYVMIMIVIAMLLIAINSMNMGKGILKPILNLQKGSRIIGEGNFDHKFDLPVKDEISELSRSFDLMTERLKKITVSRDKLEEEIKERKRIEEEQRLRSEIASNMSEGVYLIRVSDGVILYTNPKFEKMFGYGPGEMVGKYVSIVNAPTEMTPDETVNHIVGIMKQTGVWQGEIQNIKKDGTPFWCYASASIFKHPEYGEIIVSVHTDIDEHKRAEEALRDSEERFRTSVENMLDGFAIFSAIRDDANKIVDFRYEYINQAGCTLNQRTREEQLGHTLLELLPVHKNTGLFDEYVQVTETGQPFSRLSYIYEDVFGGDKLLSRAFDFQAVKMGDGFIANWRDVTEQVRSEEALRQAHDELEQRVEERTAELAKANEQLNKEIGERKQTEKDLRLSEKRYRTVVQDQTDVICRFRVDGTFTFVNDVYCRFFGKSS